MGAAPPPKPSLRTAPRPIPAEDRARRDDEVREQSAAVWLVEDAQQQAFLRSRPLARRLQHRAEAVLLECRATYSFLFSQQEKASGEVEAVRRALGRGDHAHVSETLYRGLVETLEVNAQVVGRPQKEAKDAVDVVGEIHRHMETGSRIAPCPAEDDPQSIEVAAYRRAALEVVNERPAPGYRPRYRVLRFSPVVRINVYDNLESLAHQAWAKRDEVAFNKRLAHVLQRKLGGRRWRRLVEGDEEALAAAAGFAGVGAWVDAAAPVPRARSPFACLFGAGGKAADAATPQAPGL